MKKKIAIILLCFIMIILCTTIHLANNDVTALLPASTPIPTEIPYYVADDIQKALMTIEYHQPSSIEEAQSGIDYCNDYIATLLAAMPVEEEDYTEQWALISVSLNQTFIVRTKYEEYIAEETYAAELLELWNTRSSEYPNATKIWRYLTETCGFTEPVAAGILGNIMCEAGNLNLEINEWARDSSGGYFGICQWSYRFYPEIQGEDLDTQLEFLKHTIQNEFDTFGYAYSSDFYYADFLEIESAAEAAEAFARCYERCAASTIPLRREKAVEAYEYFHVARSLTKENT